MKYNIISYLIGDGIRNIAKNKKSTISAIVIMLVTMMTVGICYIIGQNANDILNKMQKDYPLEVFLEEPITVAEKEKLEEEIKNLDYVNPNITYVSKEGAYHRIEERFGKDSAMLIGYTETQHPYPPSFIITFTDLNKLDEVAQKIETFDHVKETTREDQKDNTKALTTFTKNANITLFVIGGILVVFSIVIIGNTIKLTVHARRKEISIMKYVGATNNFIRAPFIVEGIVIGVISSLFSLIILAGVYVWIRNSVIGNGLAGWLNKFGINSGFELLEFSQLFQNVLIIFLCMGIGIGVVGSILSMKKYLKV